MTAPRPAPAPGTSTADPTDPHDRHPTALETPMKTKLTALVLTAAAVLGLAGVTAAAAAPEAQVTAAVPCCK